MTPDEIRATVPPADPAVAPSDRLRAYLTSKGPNLTRAVRAGAAEWGVGEATVWRWLSGQTNVPKLVVRELDRAEQP